MNIILDDVDQIDKGIWRTNLLPREISVFGECPNSFGPTSIIILFDPEAIYDDESATLKFELRFTTLVNKGSSNDTLIIKNLDVGVDIEPELPTRALLMSEEIPDADSQTSTDNDIILNDQSFFQLPPREQIALSKGTSGGDRSFINHLVKFEKAGTIPTELRTLGQKLLYEIRNHHDGSLEYRQKTKRYDETPVFIWAVKIQPRVKSLRIIAKGSPDSFRSLINKEIKDLNDDMTGFSTFTINKEAQLRATVSIILKAFEDRRK